MLFVMGMSASEAIFHAKSSLTFFEKYIFDLPQLIFCLEASQNFFRQSIMASICPSDAHANKIRSSTKNKWERRGDRSWKVGLVSIALSLQQPILGGLIFPCRAQKDRGR